ncbi:Uma2 family endonuclease [Streptosporangium becharense]|uniref:Uma2 family endonuclease n=1 Tax=Streptosporangium becharense TaxID=1816182 RepID=A0A7W9MGM7_9ACTN|nr:Uma2 family endonuclease [Streptosporangium becharense]MBB2909490.1 Uma2 family endonuclease [Streptosporangium becharense]MBB5819553.1 Uma2 family endonuclease [Streptosporangium becharense]
MTSTLSENTGARDVVRDPLANWPLPPPGGWTADDLDRLPIDGPNGELDLFKHVELVDGALILMSPQRRFHEYLLYGLRTALNEQAPGDLKAVMQMDVTLGPRQRPCPDVVVVGSEIAKDRSRTSYTPDEVHLVVEVVSPESEFRDREVKPRRYAEAGIRHFWLVENSDDEPVVHVYRLDPVTRSYVPTGVHSGRLRVTAPFPVDVDLAELPD